MTNDKGEVMSVSGEVMSPVAPPVLADGLFQHSAKTDHPFETDVTAQHQLQKLHPAGDAVHGACIR